MELSDDFLKENYIKSVQIIAEATFRPKIAISYSNDREDLIFDSMIEYEEYIKKLQR